MSSLTSLLEDLQACTESALAAAGQGLSESAIVNGDIPWDNRCPGWFFVRNGAAAPQGGDHRCSVPMLTHSIYIGVLRCVSVIDDNGVAPSTQTMTAEAMDAIADSEAILALLNCDFNWAPYGGNRKIIGWTPLGPSGGYAGGEWQVDVRLIPPCGC